MLIEQCQVDFDCYKKLYQTVRAAGPQGHGEDSILDTLVVTALLCI